MHGSIELSRGSEGTKRPAEDGTGDLDYCPIRERASYTQCVVRLNIRRTMTDRR